MIGEREFKRTGDAEAARLCTAQGKRAGDAAQSVTVRAAGLSLVPGMARCHSSAFPGAPTTEVGDRWLRHLYAYYVRSPEGIACAAVASDGRVVGLVVGGPAELARRQRRSAVLRLFPVLLWRALMRPVLRKNIRAGMAALLPRKRRRRPASPGARAPKKCGLLSIGVLPEHWGTGVADRLMDCFMQCAAGAGHEAVALTVRRDNPRAIRFYERHGWEPAGGNGTSVRYRKALDAPAADSADGA